MMGLKFTLGQTFLRDGNCHYSTRIHVQDESSEFCHTGRIIVHGTSGPGRGTRESSRELAQQIVEALNKVEV